MKDYRLVPMYNTTMFLHNWKYFADGMEEVMKYADVDTSIDDVFNRILGGEYLFWACFVGEEYRGFVTTAIRDIPLQGKFLLIVHIYSKPIDNMVSLLNEEHFSVLYNHAKEQGCRQIKFFTRRNKAWEQKLKSMNFRPAYTEFARGVI